MVCIVGCVLWVMELYRLCHGSVYGDARMCSISMEYDALMECVVVGSAANKAMITLGICGVSVAVTIKYLNGNSTQY